MPTPKPTKTCTVCNRPMTWRKKWARHWDDVKYCSAACRKRKRQPPAKST